MIDSHCHLAGPEYAGDLDAVVTRARDAGVTAALVILGADDPEELDRAATVATVWPAVRFSTGVHPHAAGKFAADAASAANQVDTAIEANPLVRAVGEIGLDYHYDFAPRDVQQAVFAAQLRLARRRRLPVIIHTREAEDDTFRVLSDEHGGDTPVVFHCFTGDRTMARRALDAGFYLSLAGIVTFPKALELKEVAALVPPDRLLIETDSPFLAPVPHRGKRNEPAHVARVAESVAALRGVTVTELAETTRANFERLFAP
jgi:TatD DNase family protein